jgi:rubrerythrin
MPMSIRERIKRAQKQIEKQTKAIVALQTKCSHPKFIKGLTIVACVQECWICEDCGYTKPLHPDWFSVDPNG